MLRILPLGGLGEVGMNCLAIEQTFGPKKELLMVDCGVAFHGRPYGVDVVHPNFDVLQEYDGDIVGVFITHGHEDHIGALPYLLRRFDLPIYAPPYAKELIERKFYGSGEKWPWLRSIQPRIHLSHRGQIHQLGGFEIEPLGVVHSIADSTALSIRCKNLNLVHTGDFKFDDSMDAKDGFDEGRMLSLAEKGVDVLLSDSTNIASDGHTLKEKEVEEKLASLILEAKQAVVTSFFASNVHRMRALCGIAKRSGRKMVLLGRSMAIHVDIARQLGHLSLPDDMLWPESRLGELPRNKILILATGSQSEPGGALTKLSRDEFLSFSLHEGDTVILSSRIIPGSELAISSLIDALLRLKVIVFHDQNTENIHASGHACRSEQTRMINLIRPQAMLPIHGTLNQLHEHAKLAESMGVSSVLVAENGQDVIYEQGKLKRGAGFKAGKVHVAYGEEISDFVLATRKKMAERGLCFVTLMINRWGKLQGPPSVHLIGVTDDALQTALSKRIANEIYKRCRSLGEGEKEQLQHAVYLCSRQILFREIGFKPETVTTILVQ